MDTWLAMEGSRVVAVGSKVVVVVVDNTCIHVSQLCLLFWGIPSCGRTLRSHTSYIVGCLCTTVTSGVYVIQ